MLTSRVTPSYILCFISGTVTHIQREREKERERERESSKLRCGFVSLMNLQWDSTESPFTYTYVINTTYYYIEGIDTIHRVDRD
jgi:hypothetical protein